MGRVRGLRRVTWGVGTALTSRQRHFGLQTERAARRLPVGLSAYGHDLGVCGPGRMAACLRTPEPKATNWIFQQQSAEYVSVELTRVRHPFLRSAG